MGCREHSECDCDRRDLIAKRAHRLREKDPPKLWLAQQSKSRHCLDSKGSDSTPRRNTPAGPSQATAIAYRSELKSPVLWPWISAQPQSTAHPTVGGCLSSRCSPQAGRPTDTPPPSLARSFACAPPVLNLHSGTLLRDIRATRCVVLEVYSNRTSGATHKTVSDRARFRI